MFIADVCVYFSEGSIVCEFAALIKWLEIASAGIQSEQSMKEIIILNIKANEQNLDTSQGAINYEGLLENITTILGKTWLQNLNSKRERERDIQL